MPFMLHPKFTELKQAIINDDATLVTEILRKFSLLRDMERPDYINYLNTDVNARAAYNNDYIISIVDHLKTPEMIYAVIAAGFPVYDLMRLFKQQNNNIGLHILKSILPNISEVQTNKIEDLKNANDAYSMQIRNKFDICVMTQDIPKIPVKISGEQYVYDLNTLVDSVLSYPAVLNSSQQPISKLIDTLVLNIEYVKEAHKLLQESLQQQDPQLGSNNSLDNQDIKELENIYNILNNTHEEILSNLAKLDDIRGRFREPVIVIDVYSISWALFSFTSSYTIISLLAKTIENHNLHDNPIYSSLEPAKMVAKIWCVFELLLALKTTITSFFDSIVNVMNDENNLFGLQSSLLFRILENATGVLAAKKKKRVELNNLEEITRDNLEQAHSSLKQALTAKYKNYNFSRMQNDLPIAIASRFNKEYTTSPGKFPSLYFWKQAFDAYNATSLLFRILGDAANPRALRAQSRKEPLDIENLTENNLSQAKLQSDIPPGIVSVLNLEFTTKTYTPMLNFKLAFVAEKECTANKGNNTLTKYNNKQAFRINE